jgi:mono/diheme cytochrome c family protein
VTARRFEALASLVAAVLLALAGSVLWRQAPPEPAPATPVTVAWRCAPGSSPCVVVAEAERCTRCHDAPHAKIDKGVVGHETLGCVVCHGGDGAATARGAAHVGLLSGGVEARCALCHVDTIVSKPAHARATYQADALARGRMFFRDYRCGACHVARDGSPSATPLETLGLRGTTSQIVAGLETHGAFPVLDLHLDAAARQSVAARLRGLETPEAATALLHRANVPGSSAEEGKTLYANLGCSPCHDDFHMKLDDIVRRRTADWLAYDLANPRMANAASTMPSFHLSAREASSLALHLVGQPPADAPTHGDAKEGEALMKAAHCDACHAAKLAPQGPSLMGYGDTHDDATVMALLANHRGYALSESRRHDLATYVVSHVSTTVRPDLRVPAHEGEQLYGDLVCGGCHKLDDTDALSLHGEGSRVRPQWLFEFLRAPDKHRVRPAYHPELAYRDLVPAERVTRRMPVYDLDDAQITSVVRFFTERDGASYPYASASPPELTGEALTGAIGDLTRKDRGACLSCHTVTWPDPATAREQGERLAPPLALAHERLRPEWVDAVITQPDRWVHGMPAFDRPAPEVARLRDLVFLLRDRTVLPPAGAEGTVPALGLGNLP